MTASDGAGAPGPISRSRVARLLNPRSIAIIGVSERENTAGRQVLANLGIGGFSGDIHLVARNAKQIDGRACLGTPDELPPGVDCAVLTVPGAAIEETVEALARRDVASVMCFASGFAEIGGTGRETQDRIAAVCRAHDIAFAGPNCLGFTNAVDNVAITFANVQFPQQSNAPRIGIVVQSGGMATVLRTAAAAGLGFTYAITTGNEAVVGVEDYLPFLIEDPGTRVVAILMEQIRQPEAFLRHAAAAREAGKPIVLLHLSRGAAAKHSATTHTGAMPGEYAVMEAFVRTRDVILVDTIDELIDVSVILAHYPTPPGGGIGVVTESGAFKGLALDFCQSVGLTMTEIQSETRAAIAAAIPEFVEATNPVDLTAQAIFDTSMYRTTMKALLDDPGVGAVMLSMMVGSPDMGLRKAEYAVEGKAGSDKPVLCAFLGGDQPIHPDLVPMLADVGVPFFRSPERGFRAIARVLAHGDRPRAPARPRASLQVEAPEIGAAGPVAGDQVRDVLASVGLTAIDAGPGTLPDTDTVGHGIEMAVWALRDPAWGPVLKIGLGGALAAALDDSRYLPADCAPETIAEAVDTLNGAALLRGMDGAPPADIPAFAAAVARLGALMLATPRLAVIEIQSLIVYPVGCRVVGSRVQMLAE